MAWERKGRSWINRAIGAEVTKPSCANGGGSSHPWFWIVDEPGHKGEFRRGWETTREEAMRAAATVAAP